MLPRESEKPGVPPARAAERLPHGAGGCTAKGSWSMVTTTPSPSWDPKERGEPGPAPSAHPWSTRAREEGVERGSPLIRAPHPSPGTPSTRPRCGAPSPVNGSGPGSVRTAPLPSLRAWAVMRGRRRGLVGGAQCREPRPPRPRVRSAGPLGPRRGTPCLEYGVNNPILSRSQPQRWTNCSVRTSPLPNIHRAHHADGMR